MFERFTTPARESVQRAQEEARELRHPSLGTEHLLLGVARVDGPAAQALASHGLTASLLRSRVLVLTEDGLDPDALATVGIDLEQVRQATEAHLGPGALNKQRPPVKSGHLPLTKHAKKALELSLREALHLKSGEIGTGHLLLGLLREGEGLAVRVLAESRVDLDALRADVTALMADRAA
ncbi:MAG TPA: Clp protease N-terminal domain-containing protein [Frankiaceae bacterium]|jgi:ATP-dependent Clp protease ATP-binding subunit ClpA|nr:Clp protease N-terminal domain-containing protein [Frankiaceae bacterium]